MMTEFQEKAIAAIEAQQAKVKDRSPQWMVALTRRSLFGTTGQG